MPNDLDLSGPIIPASAPKPGELAERLSTGLRATGSRSEMAKAAQGILNVAMCLLGNTHKERCSL